MPSGTLNRVIWGAMLVLLVVLAVQSRKHFAAYFAGVGTLDVRAAPGEDTLYLSWDGKIEAPMADRIAEAFESHKGEAHTLVLSLSSPGGSLNQGASVIRLLSKIKETHRLVTRVESGAECASMCVPVYLQGASRLAAADAEFMFHEVSFRDFFAEGPSDVPESATNRETDRLFVKYFETAGVSATWITSIRAAMAGNRDVWKTGRELVEENAGIVQRLL